MSKTYRSAPVDWWRDKQPIIEEDEDTDPRSYNVIQRNSQERDARRVEEAVSDEA